MTSRVAAGEAGDPVGAVAGEPSLRRPQRDAGGRGHLGQRRPVFEMRSEDGEALHRLPATGFRHPRKVLELRHGGHHRPVAQCAARALLPAPTPGPPRQVAW
jgi:hypothetical protein